MMGCFKLCNNVSQWFGYKQKQNIVTGAYNLPDGSHNIHGKAHYLPMAHSMCGGWPSGEAMPQRSVGDRICLLCFTPEIKLTFDVR